MTEEVIDIPKEGEPVVSAEQVVLGADSGSVASIEIPKAPETVSGTSRREIP